jgi:DNA end-binding protein Ku
VLKIGTNKVPVKLYSAVQDRSVHFHILDTSTKQPIKQRMVDPQNDEEVAKDEIQRGLELEPGTFVVIEEDELAKLEPKASRDIEVRLAFQMGQAVRPSVTLINRTCSVMSPLANHRTWPLRIMFIAS